MKDWQPVDWIVGLVAGAVVFFMCMIISNLVFNDIVISDERATVVAQIITSLITIISIYVGAKIRHKD